MDDWLVTAMAVTLGALAAAAADSILTAGDFADGKLGPWRPRGPVAAIVELAAPVAGTRYAARLDNTESKRLVSLTYREDIMVEPETVYELAFQYRCPDRRALLARFRVAGATFQQDFPAADSWQPTTMRIVVPPDGQAGILDFFIRDSATADAQLTAISLTPTGKGDFRPAEDWAQLSADTLRLTGWSIAETPDYLVATRGNQREYLGRGPDRMLREGWQRQRYRGLEVQRQRLHLSRVPVGVYLYAARNLATAAARGQNWRDTFDLVFTQLAAHNVNTVFIGNTYWNEERDGCDSLTGLHETLDIAQQHGIDLVLQPSATYFRPKETEAATRAAWQAELPAARDLCDALDRHPALLAWCFKEEVAPQHAPWLEDYYRELRALPFTKPFYLLNNNIASGRRAWDPAPDIVGFDRYFFKYVTYLSYLRPPRGAIEGMVAAIDDFQRGSRPLAVPFVYVGAGVTTRTFAADATAAGFELEPERGWVQDPATGLWSGVTRYYPPPGGMHVQAWTTIALGGKGILFWLYGIPPGPPPATQAGSFDSNACGLGSDCAGKEPPQLAEVGDLGLALRFVAPYVLHMNRRVLDTGTCDAAETLVTTHAIEGSGETVLAVVNLHLGTVGDKSPRLLADNDVLSADLATGQLVGFTPAPPRELTVRIPGATAVYDLRTEQPLAVVDDAVAVALPRGEGTLLLLGTAEDAAAIQQRFAN